jgi:hypothetical protein
MVPPWRLGAKVPAWGRSSLGGSPLTHICPVTGEGRPARWLSSYMNTPRSKPRKHHTGRVPRLSRRPDGSYSSGLWSETHAMLLGQIASYWVVVEEEMIEILRDLIGGDKKLPARQIFRSIASKGQLEKRVIQQ